VVNDSKFKEEAGRKFIDPISVTKDRTDTSLLNVLLTSEVPCRFLSTSFLISFKIKIKSQEISDDSEAEEGPRNHTQGNKQLL
jgi:hypothetical protein